MLAQPFYNLAGLLKSIYALNSFFIEVVLLTSENNGASFNRSNERLFLTTRKLFHRQCTKGYFFDVVN